jgi:hypothetical protein
MAPKDVEEQLQKEEKAHWKAVASAMRAVMGSEGWDSYRRELELAEIRLTERLIGCSRDEFDRIRGQIEGLREAQRLPAHIIARADAL